MKLTEFATIMGAGAAFGLVAATIWPTIWWPALSFAAFGIILFYVLGKLYPES